MGSWTLAWCYPALQNFHHCRLVWTLRSAVFRAESLGTPGFVVRLATARFAVDVELAGGGGAINDICDNFGMTSAFERIKNFHLSF